MRGSSWTMAWRTARSLSRPNGSVPDRHFVEDDAQGPEVGPGVDFVAAGLFGRHVGDRPHGRSGLGQPGFAGQLGQSEIEDLGQAVRGDHDIARLDVAVDDAVFVGLGQSLGDLGGDADRVGRGQRAAGDPLLEGLAGITGHGDVETAVLRFVDVVNGADVRVVEARRGAGLVDEPLPGLGIGRESGRQELQGDPSVEAEVLGLVDDAHAAPAELADDAELPGDGLPGLDLSDRDPDRSGRIIPHVPLHPASLKA